MGTTEPKPFKLNEEAKNIEVVEATEVKTQRKRGFTARSLGAFTESVKAIKDEQLLTELEFQQLLELNNTIRERWINKNL